MNEGRGEEDGLGVIRWGQMLPLWMFTSFVVQPFDDKTLEADVFLVSNISQNIAEFIVNKDL